MPVRSGITRTKSASNDALLHRLAQELRAPAAAGQPLIYLEPNDQFPTRVIVVWDDWSDLDVEERSRIILDAVLEARGQPAMLDIVVALGVTSAEAQRMKIPVT